MFFFLMIRRPPRSTLDRSSAASDVYKRQVRSARSRGLKLIIAGAGSSAHLAGVTAAETILPVIGVPIDSSPLSGLDALLATVQMPPGVPVSTMGVGKSGATNAGILAVQIIALADEALAAKLTEYKAKLEVTVAEKSKKVSADLGA